MVLSKSKIAIIAICNLSAALLTLLIVIELFTQADPATYMAQP